MKPKKFKKEVDWNFDNESGILLSEGFWIVLLILSLSYILFKYDDSIAYWIFGAFLIILMIWNNLRRDVYYIEVK